VTFGRYLPPVIVDASAAVEFLDANPKWRQTFDGWAADDRMLLAPPHFMPEVANGQLARRLISAAEVARRLERLSAVGIETADRGLIGLLEAIELADKHKLTVYDALYLQLAIDVDGELATLDADLRRAAAAEQVPVVGS
jgi:predicted nucleic acid-binding protein